MFKFSANRRIQCSALVFGLAIDDSMNMGPCYTERPNWRLTLCLGWFYLDLRIYRVSGQKWKEFLKTHHLPELT